MSAHRKLDHDGDLAVADEPQSRRELAFAEGEERYRALDMRLEAAQALSKVTRQICADSPGMLLRGAFRAALATVMTDYQLHEKDRGLLIRIVRRSNALGPQFVAALGLEDDDLRPKGVAARARDAIIYPEEDLQDREYVSFDHYHPKNEI